jgi:hypothetical protein
MVWRGGGGDVQPLCVVLQAPPDETEEEGLKEFERLETALGEGGRS